MLSGIPPNPRNDSLTRYLEAKLGKPSNVLERDTLRKYLDNNRMVLRFWCFWDDRNCLYGQRRPYALHYFLEDDTGEILECFETNSGRDPFPVFQKRGPLVRVNPDDRTKLHGTTMSVFQGNAFTALGASTKHREIYEPRDFRIGESLWINSREFFIYDCDDFTRNWYKNTMGLSDEELKPIDIAEKQSTLPRPSLPPYNGFGSFEDSRQNCIMLVPKPPKKDFLKLMNKDSIVLRFSATLHATRRFRPSEEEVARAFVVTYFMADDTIAIFERPLKNLGKSMSDGHPSLSISRVDAGLVSGKFLERAKIWKPDRVGEPYTYRDLYVGAVVDFHRRGFLLHEADEYTYTYMENNKHFFHLADPETLIAEIRKQTEEKKSELRTKLKGLGSIDSSSLTTVLVSAGLDVVHHQLIAMERQLSREQSGPLQIDAVLGAFGLDT